MGVSGSVLHTRSHPASGEEEASLGPVLVASVWLCGLLSVTGGWAVGKNSPARGTPLLGDPALGWAGRPEQEGLGVEGVPPLPLCTAGRPGAAFTSFSKTVGVDPC